MLRGWLVTQGGAPSLCPPPLKVLLDHSDEVWHLQFSHDGRQLASCGKDQTAVLWDVRGGAVAKRTVLHGHRGPIAFLCWSPDDAMLATCGQDALRIWDVVSGECLRVFGHHKVRIACGTIDGGRRPAC